MVELFGTLKFNQKRFKTTLKYTLYWDYRHTTAIHVDSPGVDTCEKILNLSAIDEIRLKCDVIDGSVVKRKREPNSFSFNIDKAPAYKTFCELETNHFKKLNKAVLNAISFYLEKNNHEEVNFNGETLTFTLQMIEI